MMLKPSEIENCINYVLQNGSPAAKYQTHTRILRNNRAAAGVWPSVLNSAEVRHIFKLQNRRGYWNTGRYRLRGGESSIMTPKYETTVWYLVALGELGLTFQHPKVNKACEWVLSQQLEDGSFTRATRSQVRSAIKRRGSLSGPAYDTAITATALSLVGMENHHQVVRAYRRLIETQTETGSWMMQCCHKVKNYEARKGCPWIQYWAIRALHRSDLSEARTSLIRALDWTSSFLEEEGAEAERYYYEGYNMPILLSICADAHYESKATRRILDWFLSQYDRSYAKFGYFGPALSKVKGSLRRDGFSGQSMRYNLRHTVPEDWLNFHGAHIASRLAEYG